MNKGTKIYESYLAAKAALVDNLKRVVGILMETDSLDISDPSALPYFKKLGWVSNYQWKYSEGHETIYCRASYKPSMCQGLSFVQIKVPLRYLGMTDEDIWVELGNKKLDVLNTEREKLLAKRQAAVQKIDTQIAALDTEILSIKSHGK